MAGKSPAAKRRSAKCMAFLNDYYRKNYHILNSRNGDVELLDELEMVLGISAQPRVSKIHMKYNPCDTFVIYGHHNSKFDKRPTRRAFIPPECTICLRTIKLNDYS